MREAATNLSELSAQGGGLRFDQILHHQALAGQPRSRMRLVHGSRAPRLRLGLELLRRLL